MVNWCCTFSLTEILQCSYANYVIFGHKCLMLCTKLTISKCIKQTNCQKLRNLHIQQLLYTELYDLVYNRCLQRFLNLLAICVNAQHNSRQYTAVLCDCHYLAGSYEQFYFSSSIRLPMYSLLQIEYHGKNSGSCLSCSSCHQPSGSQP